jgi:K+-sensing histidine kinase KdpD
MRLLGSRCERSFGVFPAKARALNLYFPMVEKLAKAGAKPAASGHGEDSQPEEPVPHRLWMATIVPLLLALAGVVLVTAVLLMFSPAAALNVVPVAYLIPVIVAATRWGIWPATLASIVATMAADFFFFTPRFSLQVDDPQEAVDLLLFLIVALVSSNLASRLRRETETLCQREQEIQQLYEFSRRLAACFTVSDLISAIQNYLSGALGQQVAFFAATADGHFESPEPGVVPKAVQAGVGSICTTAGFAAQTVVDEPSQQAWLLSVIRSANTVHGLVAVNIGSGSPDAVANKTRRVETILEEVSLTLQRLDIEKAMADARLHLQAQLLRDAFHGTLSHELCTPLAIVQGSASVLESMPAIRADTRVHSLVEAISDEVAHLDGFIQNLLNATRVTAGGINPRLAWADPRDILNAAIRRRARRLAAHRVELEFAEDSPLVHADSGLIEEACGQLLENAAKYSPSGSTITVGIRAGQERVVLTISDQGVGIAPDDQLQLGRKSFRSPRHQATIPGSGLGFWIASTFVKANGGTIDVSSRGQGQGTTAAITLPGSPLGVSEFDGLDHE